MGRKKSAAGLKARSPERRSPSPPAAMRDKAPGGYSKVKYFEIVEKPTGSRLGQVPEGAFKSSPASGHWQGGQADDDLIVRKQPARSVPSMVMDMDDSHRPTALRDGPARL